MGQACAPCEQAATGASAKQEVSWGTEFAETVLEKHFGDGNTSLGHVIMFYITLVWVCVCCSESVWMHHHVCTNCTAAPIWGGDTPLSARAFSRGTEEEERDGPSKFTDVRMASWHWTVIQICCTKQDSLSKGREYRRCFEFSSGKFYIVFVIEDAQDATAASEEYMELNLYQNLPSLLYGYECYCFFVTSRENNELCEVICNWDYPLSATNLLYAIRCWERLEVGCEQAFAWHQQTARRWPPDYHQLVVGEGLEGWICIK